MSETTTIVIPDVIVQVLRLGVAFLVAQGVKGFAAWFNRDVSKGAAQFTAVIVATIVYFVQSLVGVLPIDQQQAVVTFIDFLATFLGMVGAHKTYKGLSTGG